MTTAAIKKRRRLKRSLIFVLAVLAAFLVVLEVRIRPAIESIAVVQGKRLCTKIINEAVSESLAELSLTYTDLAETTRDESGAVLEITSNMANINRLKTDVSLKISEKLGDVHSRRIDMPLGTIFGLDYFYMKGPDIPLHITMSGSAETDFHSEFESGGLNQTVHRLSLSVTADVAVLIPPASQNTSVSTSVIIAETVIVGDVPNYAVTVPSVG